MHLKTDIFELWTVHYTVRVLLLLQPTGAFRMFATERCQENYRHQNENILESGRNSESGMHEHTDRGMRSERFIFLRLSWHPRERTLKSISVSQVPRWKVVVLFSEEFHVSRLERTFCSSVCTTKRSCKTCSDSKLISPRFQMAERLSATTTMLVWSGELNWIPLLIGGTTLADLSSE